MTLAPPSQEQKEVIDYLNTTDENAFITGKAGAGKTHVLRWFQKLTSKNVAICAPTGIAALNAGGATIHNLLGLGADLPADTHTDIDKIRRRGFLRELDALVIDEVSMVSSDLMDSVDRTLQRIRHDSAPFGGLQIIMFGDIYQLPPVVARESKKYYEQEGYKSEWFFDAHVWRDTTFKTFSLQNIHRQSDDRFITLLNGVRDGSITQDELNLLNAVGRRPGMTKNAMLLGSRRDTVAEHNRVNLAKIKGRRTTYNARVNTGFGRVEPAEREIHLKIGARVMLLSNDPSDRWVNGTQGVVRDLMSDSVEVELDNGMTEEIERFAWVKAGTPPDEWQAAPKYRQIPIKLAWAVTIHKSQGLSLSEIQIDLGMGAFSPGQTYVALSRVTTPEGLYIRTPLTMRDIKVDPNVKRFFEGI